MYIIINKTQDTITKHIGHFPDVEDKLNNGDKITIISLYSNTIKEPYSIIDSGIIVWEWKENPL